MLVWGIFVDEGRISQCLSDYGPDRVKVEISTLSNGYDLRKASVCTALLRRRELEKPDKFCMAPPRDPWSQF